MIVLSNPIMVDVRPNIAAILEAQPYSHYRNRLFPRANTDLDCIKKKINRKYFRHCTQHPYVIRHLPFSIRRYTIARPGCTIYKLLIAFEYDLFMSMHDSWDCIAILHYFQLNSTVNTWGIRNRLAAIHSQNFFIIAIDHMTY